MRKIRIALIIISLLALIVVSAFLTLYVKYKPSYSGEEKLATLKSEVTVVYDEWGVPHIYGETDEDAFKALGYVHAKDRLFQMDVLRRIGSGRLAEFFGAPLVDVDKFFKTLGTHKLAEQSENLIFKKDKNQAYVKLAEAYINGINEYITSGKGSVEYTFLGLEPEQFTTTDLHYTVAYMSYSFAVALKEDPVVHKMHELGPGYASALTDNFDSSYFHTLPNTFQLDSINNEDTTVLSLISGVLKKIPAAPFLGSNSWVISGKKTKSGKVLFSNDTHINFSQPSVWYEAHIHSPSIELYGNFLAGFPFPLVGHTKQHAWGLTMFENDDMDLYSEKIEGDSVQYKGKKVALVKRTETVHVKGEESISFQVRETPHGPIISDIHDLTESTNNDISVYWTLTKFPMQAPEVAYGFSFSKSIEEFKSYLPKLHAPGLNVMYGDSDGNIAWWATAKLIKRPKHVNSKLILNGASGKDEPLGWYEFTDNPHAVNPEKGYVHSANNQPDKLAVDSIFYPGYYYHGSRSEAIAKALDVKNDWDLESNKELLLHNTSSTYQNNAKFILEQISPVNETEAAAYQKLLHWNGSHNANDGAALLYYALSFEVLKLAMADELDSLYFNSFVHSFYRLRSFPKFIRTIDSPWWDNKNTPEQEKAKDIFQEAFAKAVNLVVSKQGSNPENWSWSKAHTLTHEHPLGKVSPLNLLFNVGPFEAESGEEVINKLSFDLNDEAHYYIKGGPAMRIAIDFADVNASESINPTGNSGMVFSPFYKNQAQMYIDGAYRRMYMDTADFPQKTYLTLTP